MTWHPDLAELFGRSPWEEDAPAEGFRVVPDPLTPEPWVPLDDAEADAALAEVSAMSSRIGVRYPALAQVVQDVAAARHRQRHPDLLDLIRTCRRAEENHTATEKKR